MSPFDSDSILDELRRLRRADASTHGGRVLSYVYDSGIAELDELAARAAREVQAVNGLDPTAFPSVAALEREVVDVTRSLFHGDADVVGTVTSGGTESCILAVKTARDLWRRAGGTGRARIVCATTAHAAFRKAAALLDMDVDDISVDPTTGTAPAEAWASRFGPDVALAVVSAPSYPYGVVDPVAAVAEMASERGISVHVDACIGGFSLGLVPGSAGWDFRCVGVTSLSADLHKYGYAPKGTSVLLQRGRERLAAQYFASSAWPGYPVVNPTLLGSRSAASLASAWALLRALGVEGLRELAERSARASAALQQEIEAIDGLRLIARTEASLFAVCADEAAADIVDPHRWADALRRHGWVVQMQPAMTQADGSKLPRTAHLTITPVTERSIAELGAAMREAAAEVRGTAGADGPAVVSALGIAEAFSGADTAGVSASQAAAFLEGVGMSEGLPEEMAPIMALIETMPRPLVERLLIELLARGTNP